MELCTIPTSRTPAAGRAATERRNRSRLFALGEVLAAIPRQLRMVPYASSAATAPSSLRRLVGRDAVVFEFLLIEQPDPLRLGFFFLRDRLAIVMRPPRALRRAHSLESNQHFLTQPAIDGNQIRDQADQHRLKSDDEKDCGQNQRLHVTGTVALEEIP